MLGVESAKLNRTHDPKLPLRFGVELPREETVALIVECHEAAIEERVEMGAE